MNKKFFFGVVVFFVVCLFFFFTFDVVRAAVVNKGVRSVAVQVNKEAVNKLVRTVRVEPITVEVERAVVDELDPSVVDVAKVVEG